MDPSKTFPLGCELWRSGVGRTNVLKGGDEVETPGGSPKARCGCSIEPETCVSSVIRSVVGGNELTPRLKDGVEPDPASTTTPGCCCTPPNLSGGSWGVGADRVVSEPIA